jgi:hypothetical protein
MLTFKKDQGKSSREKHPDIRGGKIPSLKVPKPYSIVFP